MDKGPRGVWPITAWDSAAGRNVITDYEVWSDDFEHDVKLRVLGDFSDLGPQRDGAIPMSDRDYPASKDRDEFEFLEEVIAELDARGWQPDLRGEPDCVDEACARAADLLRKLRADNERLRAERDEWTRGSEVVNGRLLAEFERLRAALTDIAEPKGMDNESENALRRHIARRALEGAASVAPAERKP